MDNDKADYYCRVCGLFQNEDIPPWGLDGHCPSFDICACCGVEFGYEDCSPESTKAFRKEWLAKGTPWFDPKEKPENWSIEEQLKNIPKQFK
jgi:hypothetical protein